MLKYILEHMDQKFLGCHVLDMPIGMPFLGSYKKPIGKIENETLYNFCGLDKFVILPCNSLDKNTVCMVAADYSNGEENVLTTEQQEKEKNYVLYFDNNAVKQFNLKPTDNIIGECRPVVKTEHQPNNGTETNPNLKPSTVQSERVDSVCSVYMHELEADTVTETDSSIPAETNSFYRTFCHVVEDDIETESQSGQSITVEAVVKSTKSTNDSSVLSDIHTHNKLPDISSDLVTSTDDDCHNASFSDTCTMQTDMTQDNEADTGLHVTDNVDVSNLKLNDIFGTVNSMSSVLPTVVVKAEPVSETELESNNKVNVTAKDDVEPQLQVNLSYTGDIGQIYYILQGDKFPENETESESAPDVTDSVSQLESDHDIELARVADENIEHFDINNGVNTITCSTNSADGIQLDIRAKLKRKILNSAVDASHDLESRKKIQMDVKQGSNDELDISDNTSFSLHTNNGDGSESMQVVYKQCYAGKICLCPCKSGIQTCVADGSCKNKNTKGCKKYKHTSVTDGNTGNIICYHGDSTDSCCSEPADNSQCLQSVRDDTVPEVKIAKKRSKNKAHEPEIEKKHIKVKPLSDDEKNEESSGKRKSSRIQLKGFRPDYLALQEFGDESDTEISTLFSDDDLSSNVKQEATCNSFTACEEPVDYSDVPKGKSACKSSVTDSNHNKNEINAASRTSLDNLIESSIGNNDIHNIKHEEIEDVEINHSHINLSVNPDHNIKDSDPDYTDSDSDWISHRSSCKAKSVHEREAATKAMSAKERLVIKREAATKEISAKERLVIKREAATKEISAKERLVIKREAAAEARLTLLKNRMKVRLQDHPDKYTTECVQSVERRHRAKPKEEVSTNFLVCKLCNAFQTTVDSLMEIHIEEHLNGDLDCKLCDFKGNSVYALGQHKKEVHRSEHVGHRRKVCDHCGSDFYKYSNFRVHLGKDHNDPQYPCSYCSSRFINQQSRFSHERSVHRDKIKNWCNKCEHKYVDMDSDEFSTHLSECTGRKHQCDKCGKIFTSRNSANLHRRRVHDSVRRYPCLTCSFSAFTKSRLDRHLKTHDGVHPFKCDQCPFSCIQAFQLTSHMRTHSGYKPYKCSQCNYAAAWNVQLKDHRKIHGLPISVMCDDCGVLFKNNITFTKHKKTGKCTKDITESKVQTKTNVETQPESNVGTHSEFSGETQSRSNVKVKSTIETRSSVKPRVNVKTRSNVKK